MKQSDFLSLGKRDILRSLIIAVLTPVFFIVNEGIATGNYEFSWKTIFIAGLSGAMSYLSKNLFSTPDVKK